MVCSNFMQPPWSQANAQSLKFMDLAEETQFLPLVAGRPKEEWF